MEKSISSQIEWAKDNAAAISNALQRLDGDFQKISSKRGRQEINHIAADPFISLYIEPDVRIY